MMNRPSTTLPPGWAESLLRMLLAPVDRDSVSGDLLEEYRESIVPQRGAQANRWYVRQVAWYVLRATWPWAVVFAGAFLARTAYDWRVPTANFALRSAVTTWFAVSALLAASGWRAWRSRSVFTGVVTAIATSQIAAMISVAGAAILLAIWHDPQTQSAIAGSGGLGEVFLLPFLMIIPAVVVGIAGACAGRLAGAIYGASRPNTNSA